MIEGLLISWGIKGAWSAFGPVLEDLAQDYAKDATKSYFGKCFGSVFASREPIVKTTGRAVKELLDLLEYELGLDEDTDTEELIPIRRAVDAFLDQETVQEAIASLLKEPQYLLDHAILAQAWQDVQDAPALPEDFSWLRISKRFSRKAKCHENKIYHRI